MPEKKMFPKKSRAQKDGEICSKYRVQKDFDFKSSLFFDLEPDPGKFKEYVENLIPLEFRTRYGLGSIHQLGLVVPDVEDVVPKLEARGVGPFLIARTNPELWYEVGQYKRVGLKSATAYHKGVQLEPLGPVHGSHIYEQSLDPSGRLKLHHAAFWARNVDEKALELNARGFPLVLRARISVGPVKTDAAYLDTSAELGLLVEFHSYSVFGRVFKPPASAFHLVGRLGKLVMDPGSWTRS